MIELIKSNGKVFTVNPQHIVTVEEYSDKETVITLVGKKTYVVKDSVSDVNAKIKAAAQHEAPESPKTETEK